MQFADAKLWEGRKESAGELSVRDGIFAQVSLGAFVTDVLGAFGVRPRGGDWLVAWGEATGLFSLRAWAKGSRDEMYRRMQKRRDAVHQ